MTPWSSRIDATWPTLAPAGTVSSTGAPPEGG